MVMTMEMHQSICISPAHPPLGACEGGFTAVVAQNHLAVVDPKSSLCKGQAIDIHQ
jgi:hypothetical protein